MVAERFSFGTFVLDCGQRTLCDAGREVPLSSRYFDALVLLVENGGELVSKDRFNEQVWRSIPVTDEALTQCIRSLRAVLGDKARDPRFIQTVPKHGYRFIADVEPIEAEPEPVVEGQTHDAQAVGRPAAAAFAEWLLPACAGGCAAGLVGGMLYGLLALPDGAGALSALLILLILCGGIGLLAGFGIGAGLAIVASIAPAVGWVRVAGSAIGGAVIGAMSELIGRDAFALLLGKGPQDMAGLAEGLALGLVIGVLTLIPLRAQASRPGMVRVACAVPVGIVTGAMIAFAGGRLMAGSLALLADTFEADGIGLSRIAAMFGEHSFGPLTLAFTTGFEAMLFVAFVVAALSWQQAGMHFSRPPARSPS